MSYTCIKNISLSAVKISIFTRVRSRSKNADIFTSQDEIFLVFTEKSRFSFYFIHVLQGE